MQRRWRLVRAIGLARHLCAPQRQRHRALPDGGRDVSCWRALRPVRRNPTPRTMQRGALVRACVRRLRRVKRRVLHEWLAGHMRAACRRQARMPARL